MSWKTINGNRVLVSLSKGRRSVRRGLPSRLSIEGVPHDLEGVFYSENKATILAERFEIDGFRVRVLQMGKKYGVYVDNS